MRLVWVPQWTVLPVILEDHRMVEESGTGNVPAGVQQADPSLHSRAGGVTRSGSRMYRSSLCPFQRGMTSSEGARQLTGT